MSTREGNRELQTWRKGGDSINEIRNMDYYLNKEYPFVVYPAEEGGFVAEIEELPGCITQGETLDEVAQRIGDARQAWIEVAYEDGLEIPVPRTDEEYSGKFMLRVPKYLHRRLAEQAAKEEVSLNQYAVSILAGSTPTYHRDNEQALHLSNEVRALLQRVGKQGMLVRSSYESFSWDVSSENLLTEPSLANELTHKEQVAV